MVRTPEALARQERRAEQRRDQVLDAAEQCFLAEGFHGASMARIAAAAKMSVGHIYQYFASKDAVIIALRERRFADFERVLLAAERDGERGGEGDASAQIETWIAQFGWWLDPARAPLTLEIMAEAGRNPAVAAVDEYVARAALQLIESARAELDALETGLLFVARAEGLTWPQIAERLGVRSPQAAQQRFERVSQRAGGAS